jgi:hypothetical protein
VQVDESWQLNTRRFVPPTASNRRPLLYSAALAKRCERGAAYRTLRSFESSMNAAARFHTSIRETPFSIQYHFDDFQFRKVAHATLARA